MLLIVFCTLRTGPHPRPSHTRSLHANDLQWRTKPLILVYLPPPLPLCHPRDASSSSRPPLLTNLSRHVNHHSKLHRRTWPRNTLPPPSYALHPWFFVTLLLLYAKFALVTRPLKCHSSSMIHDPLYQLTTVKRFRECPPDEIHHDLCRSPAIFLNNLNDSADDAVCCI